MEKTISKFIEDFKSQLSDDTVEVIPQSDYVNSEYWDSLTSMVIKVMIEDDYDVNIDQKEINSFKSIQELYDKVIK